MCGRKSKTFLRSMALGFVLLLSLSFPLFAASTWGALFGNAPSEQENRVLQRQLEEYSQDGSQTPSIASENTDMEISEADLMKLTQLSKESSEATEKLQESLVNLAVQVEALQAVDDISEVHTDEMLVSLNNALEANAKQADEIAELEKATKTRAYLMLGGGVGFDDGFPTLGVDLSLGTRIGNHFMIEAGVGYDAGRFDSLVSNLASTSLDNFSFKARIGWMF